jgi:hypothetical protein
MKGFVNDFESNFWKYMALAISIIILYFFIKWIKCFCTLTNTIVTYLGNKNVNEHFLASAEEDVLSDEATSELSSLSSGREKAVAKLSAEKGAVTAKLLSQTGNTQDSVEKAKEEKAKAKAKAMAMAANAKASGAKASNALGNMFGNLKKNADTTGVDTKSLDGLSKEKKRDIAQRELELTDSLNKVNEEKENINQQIKSNDLKEKKELVNERVKNIMKNQDIMSKANKREDKLGNRIDMLDEKETALKKNEKEKEQQLFESFTSSGEECHIRSPHNIAAGYMNSIDYDINKLCNNQNKNDCSFVKSNITGGSIYLDSVSLRQKNGEFSGVEDWTKITS